MPSSEVEILQRSSAVLPAAKESNRELAIAALREAGIKVVGGFEAEAVAGGGVRRRGGGAVDADQIIWTAATGARIGVDLGAAGGPDDGRVLTDECLRVVDKAYGKAYRNVFALGDVAAVKGRESRPNAQVAMAQAGCVAVNIGADERGERPVAFGMVELGEVRGRTGGRDKMFCVQRPPVALPFYATTHNPVNTLLVQMLTLGETGAIAGPGGIKIGGRLGKALRSAVYDVRKP